MPTEPTPESNPPSNTKGPLSIAFAAIVIAIGGFMLSTHNYFFFLQNKLNEHREITILTKMYQQESQKVQLLQNNNPTQTQKTLMNVGYFIHLANLHLTIGHDPSAALKTLLLAQQELALKQNAAFIPLKQALSSDINALKATQTVNTTQIFSELATMNQQIQSLSLVPAKPTISFSKKEGVTTSSEPLPWYRRFFNSLKPVKNLFVIRHLDQPNSPLMAPEQAINLKQNMMVQLSIAQWALLHRDEKIYQAALQTVSQWLAHYFALSATINPILNQMTVLEKIQMNVNLPTLDNTLTALSAIKTASFQTPTPLPSTQSSSIPTQNPIQNKAPKQNNNPKTNTTSVET